MMNKAWCEFRAGWKDVRWLDFLILLLFLLLIGALIPFIVQGPVANRPSMLQLVFAFAAGLLSLYLSKSLPKLKNQHQDSPSFQQHLRMPFELWVFRCDALIVVILFGGVFLTTVSSVYEAIAKIYYGNGTQYLLPFVSGVQFVMIFLWIFWSPKLAYRLDLSSTSHDFRVSNKISNHELVVMRTLGYHEAPDWLRAKSLSTTLLNQFRKAWFAAWICWLCLYLAMTISYVPYADDILLVNVLHVLARLFNNSATLMLALCYAILSQSVAVKSRNTGYNRTYYWIVGLLIFVLLDTICVAMSLRVLPNVFGLNPHYVTDAFDWVSGISSSIVLALLVGRLDSKFLACPTWILVMLYLYAAIQPIFPLLGKEHQWLTIILIILALVLKCLLYLYITWLLQTGRLLFYLVQVRRLYSEVVTDFNEFSLILHKAS